MHSALEKFISLIGFLESSETSDLAEAELGDDYLDLPVVSKRRILAGWERPPCSIDFLLFSCIILHFF